MIPHNWILVLSLIAGAFISEDGSVASAALLIINDQLPPFWACFGALGGIFASDLTVVALGRAASRGTHLKWLRWMTPPAEQAAVARQWLTKHGAWVTILSRFLPGTRVPVCFAAGFLRIPLPRFISILLLAATIWSLTAIWLILHFGSSIIERYSDRAWVLVLIIAVFVIGGILLSRLGAALLTRGGGKLISAKLIRMRRFEFWPIWAAYLPVFLAAPWFALRHRGWMTWSAVNPALPLSGLKGESKQQIFALLDAASAPVPCWQFLPAAADTVALTAAVIRFAGDEWPVAIKPDVGERGAGVAILQNPEQAAAYLALNPADAILQEFVQGEEFGIHFSRHPNTGAVTINSIHGKAFPEVIGDGRHRLRHLILAHQRGPLMWRHFARTHAAELDSVPDAGSRIRLTHIGNHCMGTIFLDRRDLISPKLQSSLESMLRPINGICLGRFDVRSPSADALRAGSFTILELNGVTGEPGHIYDPKGGIFSGWSALLRHWNTACAYGKINADNGSPTATWPQLRAALRGPKLGALRAGGVAQQA